MYFYNTLIRSLMSSNFPILCVQLCNFGALISSHILKYFYNTLISTLMSSNFLQVTEELARVYSSQAVYSTKELLRVRWEYAVLSMRHADEAQKREWAQFALRRAEDKYVEFLGVGPTLQSMSPLHSMYKWLNRPLKE